MSRFTRPLGERKYRRVFILSTEGEVTEPEYFLGLFGDNEVVVKVQCLKTLHGLSSPSYVLARLSNSPDLKYLRDGDQAWLVVDRDQWTKVQIAGLVEWCDERNRNRGGIRHDLALSNPGFELWLLWHFEDANDVDQMGEIVRRLDKRLEVSDKHLTASDIGKLAALVNRAVTRARTARGTASPYDYSRKGSGVDLLVTELQSASRP